MPHVSIIIPTYNREAFIRQAILSIITQSYRDFELIVIDDGSTDTTSAIIKSINDSRIVLLNTKHSGVSHARNRGIEKARGTWIAFLDSDDYWLPKKLATQIDFHLKNEDILISQTDEIWIRGGKRVNKMKKHTKVGGMIYEESLPLCLITPSSVMIHKNIFADVGIFDETLPACEDYDLWLRITHKYPVGLIDKELIVKHGGHKDQLSRSIPTLDKYRIYAMKKMLGSGTLTERQRSATIKEIENKARIYAHGCLKNGKEKEGEEYFALIDALHK
jgi:glycosyltransferase involved in cell wall biosynthesis